MPIFWEATEEGSYDEAISWLDRPPCEPTLSAPRLLPFGALRDWDVTLARIAGLLLG